MFDPLYFIELPFGRGHSVRIPRTTAEHIKNMTSAGSKAVNWGTSWIEPGVSAAIVRRAVRVFLGAIGHRCAIDLHALPDGRGWLIMSAQRRKAALPRAYRAARRRAVQAGIERAAACGDVARLHRLCDERAAIDAAIYGAGPVVYGRPGRPRRAA